MTSRSNDAPRAGGWTRRRFLCLAAATAPAVLLGCTRGGSAAPAARATSRSPLGTAAPAVYATPAPGSGLRAFRSRADLTPPGLSIETPAHGTAPGHLFVTTGAPMIVDDTGELVWYHPVAASTAANFRVQRYRGEPVLTWWEGKVVAGHGQGDYVIADTSYRELTRISAVQGDGDLHEFLLTPDGRALFTVYPSMTADLTALGGPANAYVFDGVVQAVDVASGDLRFEWRASDHVPFNATYGGVPTDLTTTFDYFHANSIDVDLDGNLLVSARNTWAVYKIDATSGRVIWTLGGRQSDFVMDPSARFAWQHDARRQPDGTITLFDDEASPPEATRSRGIVLRVDEAAMRADLVRAYLHPGTLLANSQGSMQALPNGNVLVGWGAQPYITEFSPGGDVLFDARLDANQSYRAFRQEWSGHPTDVPAVAAMPGAAGGVTVFASWNGATEVAGWRVLAGAQPATLAAVAEAARAGFETRIDAPTSQPLVAVQALDATGKVLGASAPVAVGA